MVINYKQGVLVGGDKKDSIKNVSLSQIGINNENVLFYTS